MTVAPAAPPALRVQHLVKTFDVSPPWLSRVIERRPRQILRAVDDVSFDTPMGGCLSLVGESGCGKSTVARLVTGLHRPSSGEMRFAPGPDGAPLSAQMIFQDPYASLNPRWRVRSIIAEPLRELKLRNSAAEIGERVEELLLTVGLSASDGAKFPHEFSGGQRQRISIARALASEPRFLVCDEPTSALDVSVQASILNLLADLQARRGVGYVFISHDLGVVRFLADRIGVLYRGRLVEIGPADRIWSGPRHPYTDALLAAAAHGKSVAPLPSAAPAAGPAGCAFQDRCPHRIGAVCEQIEPPLRDAGQGHGIRCHLAVEQLARIARDGAAPAAETPANKMAS